MITTLMQFPIIGVLIKALGSLDLLLLIV